MLAFFSALLLAQAVSIPGTRISLEPPPGMQLAQRFAGVESKTEEANIMVTELDAPRAELVAGFRDAARLQTQRMELLGVDTVTLGGQATELFRLKQRHAGSNYFKYIVALGQRPVSLVTAMAEEDVHEKWKPPLLAALATIVVGEKKGSLAGFTLTPEAGLRETNAISNQLLFTPGGTIPVKDPRGPMFLGSRSLAPVPLPSLAEFAEKRARELKGIQNLTITSSQPLGVDGLDGHELVATANTAQPETAQFVYEVVLREKTGGYFLLLGLAPQEQAATLLPAFRKMAASFRRQ